MSRRPERRDRGVHDGSDLILTADVAVGVDRGLTEFRDQGLPGDILYVGHDHASAFVDESADGGSPDPAGAAGDDRDLSLQATTHWCGSFGHPAASVVPTVIPIVFSTNSGSGPVTSTVSS